MIPDSTPQEMPRPSSPPSANTLGLENGAEGIPKQLQELRGIPILPHRPYQDEFLADKYDGKHPIHKDWAGKNNFSFQDDEMLYWKKAGFNLGVVGGYSDLLIIDFDNADFQAKVLPLLPKTFSVKSGGKGLLHLYFKTDDTHSTRLFVDGTE